MGPTEAQSKDEELARWNLFQGCLCVFLCSQRV